MYNLYPLTCDLLYINYSSVLLDQLLTHFKRHNFICVMLILQGQLLVLLDTIPRSINKSWKPSAKNLLVAGVLMATRSTVDYNWQ